MKTLLLADDSVTIQRVVELTFAHEDIRVVSIGDGAKAVEWIDSERPDIVVADVGAATVDGYEIAQHVKKSAALRHIPVVLLAGAFEPVDEGKAKSSGSDAVLSKPFEPQRLVAQVRELLSQGDRGAGQKAGPVETAPRGGGGGGAVKIGSGSGRSTKADTREESHELEVDQTAAAPEPLELPTSPIWGAAGSTATGPAQPLSGGQSKVSLATAFSELLAAEQSRPAAAAAAAPQIPEAAIEEAVRRILARMTGEAVRQIVLDTAERLIREEIEKIKANPE